MHFRNNNSTLLSSQHFYYLVFCDNYLPKSIFGLVTLFFSRLY